MYFFSKNDYLELKLKKYDDNNNNMLIKII